MYPFMAESEQRSTFSIFINFKEFGKVKKAQKSIFILSSHYAGNFL